MERDSERYTVISVDCHAGADIPMYKAYLESRWHGEFDDWAATFRDPWSDESELASGDRKLGVASHDLDVNWDGTKRQRMLDREGIVAEVLFPNTAPPFYPSGVITAAAPQTRPEYERRAAGLRAHNRWLKDFCGELPGRRAGIGQILLNDVDDAVEEIKWIAENLTGGIILPGDAPGSLVPLHPPKYEPVWAACADLGVPVHRHGNFPGDPVSEEHGVGSSAVGLVESLFFTQRGLAHLIFAGVFERHPDLRFVLTETAAAWAPAHLAMLDGLCEAGRTKGSIVRFFAGPAVDRLSRRPSEYFATNCYLGASFLTPSEAAMRHEIGLDRMMWGSDLPHTEGTYPFTVEALRATFADMPPEDARQILSITPAKVYGFDLDALGEVADEIGPLVSAVHQPLTTAEWPRTPEETISPVFTEWLQSAETAPA